MPPSNVAPGNEDLLGPQDISFYRALHDQRHLIAQASVGMQDIDVMHRYASDIEHTVTFQVDLIDCVLRQAVAMLINRSKHASYAWSPQAIRVYGN